MLFHSFVAPNSGVYFEQIICCIDGELDVRAFRQAWQYAVDHNEILRTSFLWEGRAEPVQLVHSEVVIPLQELDWRGLAQLEQENQLKSLVKADRTSGFVLSEAPLSRVTLIRLGGTSYQFIWSNHHALLDGWSQSLVLKQVFTAYKTLSSGGELQSEHGMPYRDYIDWLETQDFSASEDFWRKTLQGFTMPTSLSIDRLAPRRLDEDPLYEESALELSALTTAAMQSFARQHRLTTFTLLQGAWALLLSRYSVTDDVVFGTTVSVRPYELPDIESASGLFINTIPVRAQLSRDIEVLAWLKQLQLDAVETREHQQTPLVEIQQWSEVSRGRPLFESILVFENYPTDEDLYDLGDRIRVRLSHSILSRTNYPLTVLAVPGPRLNLKVVYDANRFKRSTIDRMLGHLETILADIVTGPTNKLGTLSLLTPNERRQVLVEWNSTEQAYEQDLCVHQIIAQQAARTPDAIAVVCNDQQMTYAELNARGNQLAHYLRRLGVGPESLVGICVERSLDLIVGLLGILKAGGAYIPLDPAFPKERLAFMIDDASVPVLLTQQRLTADLPSDGAKVVCLDADWAVIARQSADNPVGGAGSDNLAYVIYTSGSTGKPKGVQIGHRALTNFLCSVRRNPGLDSDDVLLSVTTPSFDIAALELYLPLVVGARLVIVGREVAADGNQLKERLAHIGATVMQATPATWKMLIDVGWQGGERFKALCGGEALSPELAWQLLKRSGSLWNMYGPTETTIWSAGCKIESGDEPISIGRPLANTQIYLLDENLNPVPIGVPGELHIGGDGLARGYLNQPELTAQKFIRNPFNKDSAARLYKTGDLARRLSNGTIEYLGRLDEQVKIRGFRIELGEIESALRQHAAVRDCVVVAREHSAGDMRLVAYVVPATEMAVDRKGLRAFLREQLPDYMMPAAVIELAELPLTPTGKVNRRALPAPEYDAQLKESYVAPRTPAEQLLAAVWGEVLKVSRVGVNDNFFELGGHSLLAVRLFARLEKDFGKRLPLATLFQAPTVRQLALILRQEGWSAPWSSLVAIQTDVQARGEPTSQSRASKHPLFCVHALGGNVLELHDLARYLGADQPFYAFQSVGLDGKQAPLTRVEEMAAHYLKEMRDVQPDGPYFIAGRSFGGTVAYEMACQLSEQGEQIGLVALLDTYPVGYYKLQPNSDSLSFRARRFIRRMKCHFDNLEKLPPGEKLEYLIEKSRFAPAKARHWLWQRVYRLFQRFNRALPETLRSVEQLNYLAAGEYVPRIYDGRVALFWASGDLTTAYDLLDGWLVLASGGIEVHEIPGNHIDIIREPHVRSLAEKLSACMEGAPEQSTAVRAA